MSICVSSAAVAPADDLGSLSGVLRIRRQTDATQVGTLHIKNDTFDARRLYPRCGEPFWQELHVFTPGHVSLNSLYTPLFSSMYTDLDAARRFCVQTPFLPDLSQWTQIEQIDDVWGRVLWSGCGFRLIGVARFQGQIPSGMTLLPEEPLLCLLMDATGRIVGSVVKRLKYAQDMQEIGAESALDEVPADYFRVDYTVFSSDLPTSSHHPVGDWWTLPPDLSPSLVSMVAAVEILLTQHFSLLAQRLYESPHAHPNWDVPPGPQDSAHRRILWQRSFAAVPTAVRDFFTEWAVVKQDITRSIHHACSPCLDPISR